MNKMLTICDEFAIGYNAISSELTNNSDKSEKRTAFISQANNVSCYFAKLNANLLSLNFYCIILIARAFWDQRYGELALLVLNVLAQLGVEQSESLIKPYKAQALHTCHLSSHRHPTPLIHL